MIMNPMRWAIFPVLFAALVFSGIPAVFSGDTAGSNNNMGGPQMDGEESMTEVFGPLLGFDHADRGQAPETPPGPPGPFDEFAREVVRELARILKEKQRQQEEEDARRIEEAAQEMIDAIQKAAREMMRSFSSAAPGGGSGFGDEVGHAAAVNPPMGQEIHTAMGESVQQDQDEQHQENF